MLAYDHTLHSPGHDGAYGNILDEAMRAASTRNVDPVTV
jgi:hypothetical protein